MQLIESNTGGKQIAPGISVTLHRALWAVLVHVIQFSDIKAYKHASHLPCFQEQFTFPYSKVSKRLVRLATRVTYDTRRQTLSTMAPAGTLR